MLKLTRLDQRTVAINPDHVAWVEANPDTTLCLLGDRKIIVRESLDEVCERFIAVRARIGGASPVTVPQQPPATSNSRRPMSGRPSGMPRAYSAPPPPYVVDDPPESNGAYRGVYPKDGE